MAYKRKTIDRWDIETNYGYGWEVENSEYTPKMPEEATESMWTIWRHTKNVWCA